MIQDFTGFQIQKFEKRPQNEGCNIGTWQGFKHLMYMAEEAVLQYFRSYGMGPRGLFSDYGLCLEIVDSGIKIMHALHVDDVAAMQVTPRFGSDRSLLLAVSAQAIGDPAAPKSFSSRLEVVLRKSGDSDVLETPEFLKPYVVERISRPGGVPIYIPEGFWSTDDEGSLVELLSPGNPNVHIWKFRIPYFYCHFSNRLRHSGYVRLMEEVVDRFLDARGMSIMRMLRDKQWIPFVSNARVEILEEALMEEELLVVYSVEEVYKDLTYTSGFDCYVARDGIMVHTATGKITHGYAKIHNRKEWNLVRFDEETIAALHGQEVPA